MYSDEDFIKHRISFEVAPYALADVLKALSIDRENLTRIVVTKEDDNLVVFFHKIPKKNDSAATAESP